MNPCAIIQHPHPQQSAEANAALGLTPLCQTIVATIGGLNAGIVQAQLKACREAKRYAVVWLAPDMHKLMGGTVDVPGLPSHPDVAAIAELLREHGEQCLVRVLFEFANRRPDTGGFNYISPAVYVAAFDGIAAKLPPNAIPSWDYEASVPVNVGEWRPKLAKAAGLDRFGDLNGSAAAKAKAQREAVFVSTVTGWGLPWGIAEMGDTGGDILTDGQVRVLQFWKPSLMFASAYGARWLAITNYDFGKGVWPGLKSGRWAPGPEYAGNPNVTTFTKKVLMAPEYLKTQPLPFGGIA